MKTPEAYITVNKDRRSTYNDDVYLNDDTTFGIELNNPTESTVAVKITIQGEKLGKKVVLRPGEKTYLNRYIDSDKAFVFNTYDIPKENKEAIKKNGEIKINFYKERSGYTNTTTTTTNDYDNKKPWQPKPIKRFPSPYWILSSGNKTLSSSSCYSNNIETGRIEKGDSTGQTFKTYNGTFSNVPFHHKRFVLKPQSTKKDSKIKKYCPGCGARKRKNWKFCAYCGDEI